MEQPTKKIGDIQAKSQFVPNNKNNVTACVAPNKFSFLFIKTGIRQVQFIDKCQWHLIKLFGVSYPAMALSSIEKRNEMLFASLT